MLDYAPIIMIDWNLVVILAAIGVAAFYLRNYVRKKAENLAQKEDLQDLTKIVEGVRSQFERVNLVHRVQFEAEFRACQDLWRVTHETFREFIRLFPLSAGAPGEGQRTKFVDAQLAFTNTLEECKPFVSLVVWKAFYDFEDLMIPWKDADIPLVERNKYREEARLSFERCATEIRKRFSELIVV
jgi:hypothetical protein